MVGAGVVEGAKWANSGGCRAMLCEVAEAPAVPALCVSIGGVRSFDRP